jgi:hypothetical protein
MRASKTLQAKKHWQQLDKRATPNHGILAHRISMLEFNWAESFANPHEEP